MKKFSDLRASNERALDMIQELKITLPDREENEVAVNESEGNGDSFVFEAEVHKSLTEKLEVSSPQVHQVCIQSAHDKVKSLPKTELSSLSLANSTVIGAFDTNKNVANKMLDEIPEPMGYIPTLDPKPPDECGSLLCISTIEFHFEEHELKIDKKQELIFDPGGQFKNLTLKTNGGKQEESSLVICFGETLIDFVFTVGGVSLAEAPAFKKKKKLLGAPANVTVGISRPGGSSAFIGKVGEDEFWYMLADILKQNNVNNSSMQFDPAAMTALAFVTLRFVESYDARVSIMSIWDQADVIKGQRVADIITSNLKDEKKLGKTESGNNYTRGFLISVLEDKNPLKG